MGTAAAPVAGSFERHLPKRVDALARRIQRLAQGGWDINALSLLHHDTHWLADTSAQLGLTDVGSGLQALERRLRAHLDIPSLPGERDTGEMMATIASLRDRLPQPGPDVARATPIFGNPSRVEVPPAGYWRRWADDAPPPTPIAARPRSAEKDQDMATALPPVADSATGTDTPAAPSVATDALGSQVFHLTDGSVLSGELDQRLEANGYGVELFTEAEQMRTLLTSRPPLLVVVDSAHVEELESIGATLRATRQRTGLRLPLATIAAEDDLGIRLNARRAGADALIIAPPGAGEVLQQLQALLEPARERELAYRVLIVEDDRSQGLFAESILRNAGMETRVIDDPFAVLGAMESFEPDLLLMDLHMPRCNGMELTALIRERDRFLHTPIVFLSGESDQDLQFEALDAGGDDFLSKPVRPRHLISAVQNRIRRARALSRRALPAKGADPNDGLHERRHVLTRIDAALVSRNPHPAGVLFIDIEGGARLRERLGLAGLECVIADAGKALFDRLGKNLPVARYGDASFIVFAPGHDDQTLAPLAADLRRSLAERNVRVDGKPVHLRAAIGACTLSSAFDDAGTLLHAAERACREARGSDTGVRVHRQPRHEDHDRELAMVGLLRQAIAGEGLELHYQPIVAVQGGNDAQYQALLRLRSGDGVLHPAAELIPLAERHGLIADIDRRVLSNALAAIDRNRRDGLPLRLFVSQSVLTLGAGGHADWLRERLKQADIPGSALVIDIRLDDVMLNPEGVKAFCESLVPDGVQFCLSQCEGGGECATLLHSLPLGYIKLASKYLAASNAQPLRDELRVLIDQAHRRNLLVIGHRVEDPQAAATLWVSGIDFLQGNLVQQAGSDLSFDFHSAVL